MATKRPTTGLHLRVRTFIYLAIMLLVLYLVVPKLGSFKLTLSQFHNLDIPWLVVALGSFLVTFLLAGGIYCTLSYKRLGYARTVIVQMAGLFVNRLLPAGSGALGVNYLYLRNNKLTKPRAIATVVANNLLGFIGHLLLLLVLVLGFPSVLVNIRIPTFDPKLLIIAVVVVAVIVCLFVLLPKVRRKFISAVASAWTALLSFRTRPARLMVALTFSVLLSICYALCLLACAKAIGVDLSPGQALLVLTVSVVATEVVPLPGGVGSAEAGIVAGIVTLGFSAEGALAIALLYRFFTFWLALIIGLMAFIFVERKKYLKLS